MARNLWNNLWRYMGSNDWIERISGGSLKMECPVSDEDDHIGDIVLERITFFDKDRTLPYFWV